MGKQKLHKKGIKVIDTVIIGDIQLFSTVYNASELVQLTKIILKDKVFKEYLCLVRKKKILNGSNYTG